MVQGLRVVDLSAAAPSLSPSGKHCTLLHLLHNNIEPAIDLPSSAADGIMWENKVLIVMQYKAGVAFAHCNTCFVKSQGYYNFKTLRKWDEVLTFTAFVHVALCLHLTVNILTNAPRYLHLYVISPKMFLTTKRPQFPQFWFRYRKEFHAAPGPEYKQHTH